MKPEHLALCVECEEVHPSHLTTCPDCGCSSAIPLSRLTEGRRKEDHLRLAPDWPYSWDQRKLWRAS